ncbi:hypothetical protein BsWGS_12889 [Bradybaena similaris]
MVLQNADTDNLQEVGGAEITTIVACSTLLAVTIVLVIACSLCINKRRPKADPRCSSRPDGYDPVTLDIPGLDPFTDNDGYAIPMDCFREANQESTTGQDKVKGRRSLKNDKEEVFVTNLGSMTKISLSSENLNTNNSWTLDSNGRTLERDTRFVSTSRPSASVSQESTEKNRKSSDAKNKNNKCKKVKIVSTERDTSSASAKVGNHHGSKPAKLANKKSIYENAFM